MRSFVLKSVTGVTVAFLTWMVTSAVVAQQAKKSAPSSVATKKVTRNAKGTQIAQGARLAVGNPPTYRNTGALWPMDQVPAEVAAAIAEGPKYSSIASAGIPRFEVAVNDGVATVSAVASLRDRREGVKYLWLLKVASTDQKTLSRQVYAHQTFGVPRGEPVAPTFQDTIAVPPGESIVELALCAFGEGTDMKVFDDEKAERGYKSASRRRTVKN